MSYMINLGGWQSVFAVPSQIVDRHLRLANAAHIKVILYLLRNSGRRFGPAEVASAVGISEADVEDALVYWRSCGLLAENNGELTPPELLPEEVIITAPPVREVISESLTPELIDEEPAVPEQQKPKKVEKVRYSYSECSEYISSSEGLRDMLQILERMMKKTLNHTEISVFVTLVQWYGLPETCVALLVEYCQSIGKGSIAYIESTGIGWAGEEINTVELATGKITRLRSQASAWNAVRAALDIPERSPTKKEKEFSGHWINEYGVSTELLQLAYERCVDSKGKLSMSYMNGIIENWHKKGINTVEQAEAESAPEKKPAADSGRHDSTHDTSDIDAMMFDEWFGGAQ